ncbi:MAG: hypothetical protein ACHQSE_02825 [Gemmatimonadales bacterium]
MTDSSGAPAANVSVSFQVLSGNGTLGYSSATTDASGLAGPGSWTLGSDVGVNFMHARIADGGGVDFSVAAATTAKVVAVYQLQSIGGQSLPRIYPDWTITGGHYYVAANGTYSFGYEFGSTPAPATICSSARYVVGSSGIDFYLAPGSYPESSFYQQRGGLFSTGTLSGASLSVKYMDVVDFDDERYALVSGSVAPLMPTK